MQRVLKLSLCGPEAVGKSGLGQRLANQRPTLEYTPTLGVEYYSRRLPPYQARISIWDLAGDDRFSTITNSYVEGASIIAYIYDISNAQSLTSLQRLYNTHLAGYHLSRGAKLVVIGNKKDLETSRNSCREKGLDFANQIGASHLVVSVWKNEGIDDIISTLVDIMNLEEVYPTEIREIDNRKCDRCFLL